METKKEELQCCVVSCDLKLGQEYWNNQYLADQIGWDLGVVSPPLKTYVDQLIQKGIKILIPGCGNTYEADYLLEKGFTDISVIDIAPALVDKLKEKYSNAPQVKVILGDFFEHNGQYDLILEQTFFCAIEPSLRSAYAKKMFELLVPEGILAGVLFDREFDKPGPPFGGCKCQYEPLFNRYFDFLHFEACYNSAQPRAGTELFIELKRKKEAENQ
jgi:SAM-dependent methyltransferase